METRDQPGVELLGKAFAQAQALGRPRARALDDDVGPAAEPLGRVSGLGRIDPPELLGAVQAVEGKRLLWALSTRPVGNGPRAPVGSPSSTRPSPPPRRGRPGAFRHRVPPRPWPAPERAHRRAVDRPQCRTVARHEALLGAPAPCHPVGRNPPQQPGLRVASDRARRSARTEAPTVPQLKLDLDRSCDESNFWPLLSHLV